MNKFDIKMILYITIILFLSCDSYRPYDLKIVYNVLVDEESDNYSVYIMDLDGSNQKDLTKSKGVDWVYKTKEDNIYFVSDRDTTHRYYFLYIMNITTGNVKKVYNKRLLDSYLAVSKDSKKLIVTRLMGKERQFILIDDSGNELEVLLTDSSYRIRDPEFINNDKSIVYASRKSGQDELWVMNLDNKESQRLTYYPKNDTTSGYFYHAGPPVWNSKDKMIYYISKQNGNHSIFNVSTNGKTIKQLTDDNFEEGWFGWSPDYKFIVFDGKPINVDTYDIYISDSNGNNKKRLTNSIKFEQSPHFVKKYKN